MSCIYIPGRQLYSRLTRLFGRAPGKGCSSYLLLLYLEDLGVVLVAFCFLWRWGVNGEDLQLSQLVYSPMCFPVKTRFSCQSAST